MSKKRIKDGYLIKKGHFRHNWKTRWFVLYCSSLCYYKKKEDFDPVKAIFLSDASIVEDCLEYKNSNKENVFKLISDKGIEYFIQASSNDERTQWVNAITEAIINLSGNVDSVANRIFYKSSAGYSVKINLRDFILALQDPEAGVMLSDCIVDKIKHSNCFSGDVLTDWLKNWSFAASQEDAINVGSLLLQHSIIQPVVNSQSLTIHSDFIGLPTSLYQFTSFVGRTPRKHISTTSSSDDGICSSVGTVVKEGFLAKKGHVVQNWKIRKIVLRENPASLEYYDVKKSSTKCLRCLSLENCLAVPIDNNQIYQSENASASDYIFSLLMPNGIQYLFKAKNPMEMWEWLKAIRSLVFTNC